MQNRTQNGILVNWTLYHIFVLFVYPRTQEGRNIDVNHSNKPHITSKIFDDKVNMIESSTIYPFMFYRGGRRGGGCPSRDQEKTGGWGGRGWLIPGVPPHPHVNPCIFVQLLIKPCCLLTDDDSSGCSTSTITLKIPVRAECTRSHLSSSWVCSYSSDNILFLILRAALIILKEGFLHIHLDHL